MGLMRLFLALVVLGTHVRADVLVPFGVSMSWWFTLGFNGAYALLMFYMISGFLISTALAEKYAPDSAGTAAFYRGRFVRIFSLYWPMAVLALILVPSAVAGLRYASPFDLVSDAVLLGSDWRVLFAMTAAHRGPWTATILGLEPAWALGAELAFYAVAPWVLRKPRLCLAVAAGSVAVRIGVYSWLGAGSLWNYLFWPSTLIFFLLGHFARIAATRLLWLTELRIWAPCLAVCFVATMWGGDQVAPWDGPRFWLSFLAFSAALPGLFAFTRKSRFHGQLGDLSYPVYLVHPIAVALVALWVSGAAFVDRFGDGPNVGAILFVPIAVLTLCAALLVHVAIEKPFGRVLRTISDRVVERLRMPGLAAASGEAVTLDPARQPP